MFLLLNWTGGLLSSLTIRKLLFFEENKNKNSEENVNIFNANAKIKYELINS